MSRRLPRLLYLLFALAGALPLAAAPAAAAPKVVAPVGAPLMLETGKGELVHLDHPASSVFVADPDIADVQVKSPTLIYVFGKHGGETTLFAVGQSDQVVLNMTIRVHLDVARVQDAIHKLVPRSAISVSSVDDSLVLEGTVYTAADGEAVKRIALRFLADPKRLVNKLKVDAPNQVNLRVRVAEVSRQVVKELGFNWQTLSGSGNFLFGLATGHPVVPAVPSLAAFPNAFFSRSAVPGATALDTVNSLSGGFHDGSNNIDVLIDALDKEGFLSVLAEPNLTAVSGEPASFLAGGEFPIPVPQGFNQVSIDFKKFGISLNFVATITANNRINMHVQPEVSQLSNNGAVSLGGVQVPALTVRRAETTVDLSSGQSFAIAGLMQNNITQSLQKFPWLGDVPVLGQLFRSQAFQRNETELVIIVTPYIVRPVAAAHRLMAPTDGYVPPSDAQLVLYGNEYRRGPKPSTTPANRTGAGLIGPVGFELD